MSQVAGNLKSILRVEGLTIFLLALYFYHSLNFSWSTFLIFFLLPDISFVGYLANNKIGAISYNAAHSLIGAWIGFNASHSLGAMLLAAVYIPLALNHFLIIKNSMWFSGLPIVVGVSYLFLAKKYWFKIPFAGVFLSSICFVGSVLLANT